MSEAKITISGQDIASEALARVKQAVKDMGLEGTAAGEAMGSALSSINTKAKELASEMRALGSVSATIGAGLTAAVTAPLVGMGAAALKSAIDFESAFSGVRKTVSGTPAELATINQQFRDMATVTPVSAVGLAKIGEMAGQLGVHKEVITGFTKTIVDISTATNLTADEAGSSFARLANVMKMPQEQFANLGSTVVALGNFGASTEQEMMNMGQRIAAAGSTAGMSAPQVLGIANALSSVGIEAESGGTAMSRVINKISMDVASGGGKLDTFAKIAGKSAQEFKTSWREDAGNAFSDFMQGLAQARSRGGDELLGLIHELGFDTNVRLVNAFMSAANAGDLMKDSIALGSKAFKENTELTRAAGERYATTANQLKILENNSTEVAMKLGDALLPILNDTISAVKPLVAHVGDAAKGFRELSEPAKLSAIALAGVAAAAGPLLLAVGGVAFTVAQVSSALVAVPALGSAAAAAFGMMTTGMIGMAMTAAGITAAAVAVGGLAYAATRLVDVASGGKLTGWISSSADLKLKTEEAAAAQDTLRYASERSGHTVTSMSEALAINAKWLADHKAAAAAAAAAAAGMVGPHQEATREVVTLADKVKGLTAEQRADILAKYDQKESLKAIAAETGIAIEIVSTFVKQQHAATAEGKAAAAAAREYAEAGENYRATVDAMSGAVVEGIRYDLARGISQKAIQVEYGVTANQIKAIIAVEKEEMVAAKILEQARADSAKSTLKLIGDELAGEVKYAEESEKATIRQLGTREQLQREADTAEQRATMNQYDFERAQIRQWVDDQMKSLDTSVDGWEQAADNIERIAKIKFNGVAQAQANAFATMKAQEMTWANGIQGVLGDLPKTMMAALTGGGGLSGFGQAIESSIGSMAGGMLITKPLTSMFNAAAPAMLNSFGSTLTTAIGGAIPFIGPAIGALAPALISGIKRLFGGVSQAEVDGRKIEGAFEQSFGGFQKMMDAVGAAYAATGRGADQAQADVKALMDAERNGGSAVQTMIDKINGAFSDQKAKAADVSAGVDAILEAAKVTGGAFPAAMAPMVAQLAALPGLTDAEKTSLLALLQGGEPSFESLTSAAGRYGLSLDDIGGKAAQLSISHEADQIASDWKSLVTTEGADSDKVLSGMKGSLTALVNHAMTAGATLPTSLQPLVKQLFDTGQLTDAAGNKITDLSKLKFDDAGDPLAKGMATLTTAIDHLGIILQGLPGIAQAAADGMGAALSTVKTPALHVPVFFDRSGDDPQAGYASRGGFISARGVEYMADGGFPGGPRGIDRIPVWAAEGEAFLNRSATRFLGRDFINAANRGRLSKASASAAGAAVGGTDVVAQLRAGFQEHTEQLKKFGASIERILQLQPAMLRHALRGTL